MRAMVSAGTSSGSPPPARALCAVDGIPVAVRRHPHDDMADQVGIDLRILERRLDRHASKLRRRETREQARAFVVV